MTKTKIGFIGSSAPASPHHDSLKAFIPANIDFTFVQEAGSGGSLWNARDKLDGLLQQSRELIDRHEWKGANH